MSNTALTRRRALVRGTTAIMAGSIAGCMGSSGSSDGDPTVTMTEDLRFDPETVRIEAGATVVWENTTEIKHTVTALEGEVPENAAYFASGGFESESAAREAQNAGLIDPDGSYEHAFDEPGTYEYVCLPHEGSGMRGSVVVRESDESE